MNGKKWAGLLCLVMMIMFMAACGNNNTVEPEAPAPTNNDSKVEPAAEKPAAPAAIKMYFSDHNLPMPKDDDPRIKFMEEKANVELNVEFLPHGQYQDQLKLKFASGDFPDVYQSWSGPSPDLIEGDKILALNDLIDQYGPNLKKVIPQAAWDAVTLKGKILAIPQPATIASGQVTFIRKDWLDKLNLQVPTTSGQLLDVMRAFRDHDFNGNGKKDEIPFSMRENISWSENIWGMWGIGTAWTEYYHNNEVILGNIHPNILKPLAFFQTMHDEKLLDSEFLTNSRSTWEQKIKAGLVGIWNHDPSLITNWNNDLKASIPDQKPEVITIPTPQGEGYDGPVGTRWSPIAKTYIVMKDAKNPEAIIRYFDWLISEEGQLFTELGMEGDTFFRATSDGQITFDTNKAKEIAWLGALFKVHGYNPETTKIKLADDAAFEKLNVAYTIANTEGWMNEAIGMPPISDQRNLTTMFREIAAKVIIGQSGLADYEKFIEAWKAQGGDELIKERTAWYDENRK